MKSITHKLLGFAAGALFLGTTAFGQSKITADVPFAFHISGGVVAAGNCVVNVDAGGSGKAVRLYNADTHQAVVTITNRAGGGPADDNTPRLIFRCGEAGCALSEVWTLNGGYSVPQGRIRPHEYLASIPLTIHQGN